MLISDTNKIEIAYDELLNVAIKEGQSRTTLEILTKEGTLEATVDTVLEAERFIRELSEKAKKPLFMNIDFKNRKE